MSASLYLSSADLQTLATRIATVFEKKSDLATTLASYYTSSETDSAIASAIAGVTQFDYQITSQLPQEGTKGIIYLVPNEGSGENIYDEYIWIVPTEGTGHFELFGTQMVELVEYKGSGTITVTDGTGADAGKKIVAVKYDSDDFTEDASDGLQLSSGRKASLALADSAVQGFTSTDSSVVVTGAGTTKDLAVSSTIQNGAAAGATAMQRLASSGSTITVTNSGTAFNAEVSSTIVDGAAAGATALQPEDIDRIGDTTINNLWT